MFRRAIIDRDKTLGPTHSDTIHAVFNLPNALAKIHHDFDASSLYLRAINVWETDTWWTRKRDVSDAAYNLGNSYVKMGKEAEATKRFIRAYKFRQHCCGPDDPSTQMALVKLADCYARRKMYIEAEQRYETLITVANFAFDMAPEVKTKLGEGANAASPLTALGWQGQEQPLNSWPAGPGRHVSTRKEIVEQLSGSAGNREEIRKLVTPTSNVSTTTTPLKVAESADDSTLKNVLESVPNVPTDAIMSPSYDEIVELSARRPKAEE